MGVGAGWLAKDHDQRQAAGSKGLERLGGLLNLTTHRTEHLLIRYRNHRYPCIWVGRCRQPVGDRSGGKFLDLAYDTLAVVLDEVVRLLASVNAGSFPPRRLMLERIAREPRASDALPHAGHIALAPPCRFGPTHPYHSLGLSRWLWVQAQPDRATGVPGGVQARSSPLRTHP